MSDFVNFISSNCSFINANYSAKVSNTHDTHTNTKYCILSQLSLSLEIQKVLNYPVADDRIWNSLPQHVTSAPLLPVLRSRLKTHLFTISYPSL